MQWPLPGEILATIASEDAGAYCRIVETCREWRKAVLKWWPKMKAVRHFTREIVNSSEMCTETYTVLPNGKKNGIYRNVTKKGYQIEIFFINGEPLMQRLVSADGRLRYGGANGKCVKRLNINNTDYITTLRFGHNFYLKKCSGDSPGRFVRVFHFENEAGDDWFFDEHECANGYQVVLQIIKDNDEWEKQRKSAIYAEPQLEKIMKDLVYREEFIQNLYRDGPVADRLM